MSVRNKMAYDPKVTITINRAALVKARELFERAGDAAEKITTALPTEADTTRARRDLRLPVLTRPRISAARARDPRAEQRKRST